MRVASATARVRFTTAAALQSQQVTATATATSSMRSACAVAPARLTPTVMAFVTMWTTAWERLTLVAFATVRERSSHVDVPAFQKGIVIAMATSRTR